MPPDRARALTLGALLLAVAAACRQDMFNQPKARTFRASDFFADGQGARRPVDGTVARGQLREDRVLNTGLGPDGRFVARLPLPLERGLVERGRERYEIFCAPCHGRVGDGRGMVVERGFKAPPSFHIDRLRQQPIGSLFDVMTHGFGTMSSYAAQVPVRDRWAIAAWVRVLQLSQHATWSEVPERDRAHLERAPRAATGPGAGRAPAPGEESR